MEQNSSFLNLIKKYGKLATYILLPISILFFILFTIAGDKTPVSIVTNGESNPHDKMLAIIIIAMFLISIITALISYAKAIIGKKQISSAAILVLETMMITSYVLGKINNIISSTPLCLIGSIINLVTLVISYIIYFISDKEEKTQSLQGKISRVLGLVINTLTVILTVSIFFLPYYQKEGQDITLAQGIDSANLTNIIVFLAFVVVYVSNVAIYLSTYKYYFKNDERYFKSAKISMYYSCGVSLVFYLVGVVLCLINGQSTSVQPLVLFLVNSGLLVIESIFSARFLELPKKDDKAKNNRLVFKIIIISTVVLFSTLVFVALGANLVTITYNTGSETVTRASIKGYDVIFNTVKYGESYKILALMLYFVFVANIITATTSIVLFFSKSKLFKTLSLVAISFDFLVLFAMELFGRYYKIIQGMNEEMLKETLQIFNVVYSSSIKYTITSDMSLLFFIGCGLLLVVLITKPFSKFQENNEIDVNIKTAFNEETISKKNAENQNDALSSNGDNISFDPCPQFSEIDDEKDALAKEYNEKLPKKFENLSLPNLTKFIVTYAKESRLHLSYSHETIAEFIAGLGMTRLSILQGMSGTGKTSLPKIFSEAILGKCNIIEVESSWKDKNELIGYYNEFSKKFTPKKFTQALYRAKLDEDTITFIVLDEMNLSRIEYYFSDFLSLMENEEDKREIKLLNIKIYKNEDGNYSNYLALSNGHTLKIPKNVWFIGTANRDESTFEISDKVYDRANTMNFNKRAPKIESYTYPIDQQFLTYSEFKEILEDAINSFDFNIEDNKIISNVEQILAPYNISFGNRIYNQIEKYVKIYCSCFDNKEDRLNEAIEKILLNKVVAKLEFKRIDNKEELIEQFDALNLQLCKEFVQKLNEDI